MEQNNKRKALGRGLEELFSTEPLNFENVETKIIEETPKDEIINVKISDLRKNPYQPRKIFNEAALDELAESIKQHGVFQPIIVKKSIKGYEIIAGERRVKASEKAGILEVPAIVRDFTDDEMMEVALLENLQRENLTPIEEAEAYKNLIEKLELTQEKLAERLGKSRTYITNSLGILTLPEEVKNLVNEKKLTMGHAKCLSKLEDKLQIKELTDKVLTENLSVRDLEKLISDNDFSKRNKIKVKKSNPYNYLEDEISEKLGTKIKINNNKLVITFTNDNDLNRLLEIMHLNK